MTVPTALTHSFGPSPDNAWTQRDDCLSLVRSPRPPRPLRLPSDGQALEFDLARSALIVVDMQNDFCHASGWFGQKGVDVSPMRAPIPAIAALLPAWRAAGGRVVWLNWGVRADRLNLSPTLLFKGKRSADGVGYAERSPDDRGPSVVAGEWGARVVDELPLAADDAVVYKHRLSGFWDNELDSLLRQQGITTLFYAGVNTDRCVFSTLQDAGFLGYDNILLADACGSPSPAYVTQAIHFLVRQLHGFVASAQDLAGALAANAPQSPGLSSTPRSLGVAP
ncbi:isochorismatase family cysteine hydrolase [Pigmentiphaga kullae]|uniref:Nicotinamidase-related amidase n=1 Tax=Pigmentiphaga kullae TaxID=151784 RepID=A0A4Q7NMD5_9BURK|nr:isochorismatase family cysteine hydrolase [Pigmentiphaga kullae]RZS85710.1 nicotinamidase-related amidase [Pigmentiphaga kullae]